MSKISKISYCTIPEDVVSREKVSEYYFYSNLMDTSEECMNKYEEHEAEQYKLRKSIAAKLLSDDDIHTIPKSSQVLFGISSMKEKCVLIAEI